MSDPHDTPPPAPEPDENAHPHAPPEGEHAPHPEGGRPGHAGGEQAVHSEGVQATHPEREYAAQEGEHAPHPGSDSATHPEGEPAAHPVAEQAAHSESEPVTHHESEHAASTVAEAHHEGEPAARTDAPPPAPPETVAETPAVEVAVAPPAPAVEVAVAPAVEQPLPFGAVPEWIPPDIVAGAEWYTPDMVVNPEPEAARDFGTADPLPPLEAAAGPDAHEPVPDLAAEPLPPVSALGAAWDDGAVGFDLPASDEDPAAMTRGVAYDDLASFLDDDIPLAEPASFVAGSVGPVPAAEPVADALDYDDLPLAEPASFAGLADAPPADAAPAPDATAEAEPEFDLIDFDDVATAEPASFVAGEDAPVASAAAPEPATTAEVPAAEAEAEPEFDLVDFDDADAPVAEPASFVASADAVTPPEAPPAEVVAEAEPEFDLIDFDDVPVAEPSSFVAHAGAPTPPAGATPGPVAEEEPAFDLLDFEGAASVAADTGVDEGAAAALLSLDDDEPVAEAEAVDDADELDQSMPAAEPASFLGPVAADEGVPPSFAGEVPYTAADAESHLPALDSPALDSTVRLGAADGFGAVGPASGWYDSTPPAPRDAAGHDPTAGSAAALGAAPQPAAESSDIFGGPWPEPDPNAASHIFDALPLASDASGATDPDAAGPPHAGTPTEVVRPGPVPFAGAAFHAPDDPVFNLDDGADLDSSLLAETPDLPGQDAADFGAAVPRSVDSSSIMGELADPTGDDFDGSGVQLMDPSAERTLTDDTFTAEDRSFLADGPDAEEAVEFTIDDEDEPVELADGPAVFGWADDEQPSDAPVASDAGGPDFPSAHDAAEGFGPPPRSGSDLFAQTRAQPPFPFGSDAGRVSPFDPTLKADQPSLTSAPSSIFTGGHRPGDPEAPPTTGGSADVRIADGTDEQTVFGADPELTADSSGILGDFGPAAAAGGIDFDLPKRPANGEATQADAEESGGIGWAKPIGEDDADLSFGGLASDAPASGIFTGSGYDIPVEPAENGHAADDADPLDATEAVEPGDLWGDDPAPARRPAAYAPAGEDEDASLLSADGANGDDSLEVSWLAGTDEPNALMSDAGDPDEPMAMVAIPDGPGVADADAGTAEAPKKKKKKKERVLVAAGGDRGGKGGWLGGGVLGLLAGVGTCAGLYFGGVLPGGDTSTPITPPPAVASAGGDPVLVAKLEEDVKKERAAAGDAIARAAAAEDKLAKLPDVAALQKAADDAKANAEAMAADLTKAKTLAAAADKDKTDALATVAGLEAAAKKAKDAADTATADAKKAADDLVVAMKDADAAKKEATDAKAVADATLSGLAKELQTAKLLPADAPADAAAVTAAVKEAAVRASGPNVATLVPSGIGAVAGTGLTAGQLLDLADRIAKSEAAAKAAADKLATETAALKEQYGAAAEELKKANAAELKVAADKAAADLKVAADKLAAADAAMKAGAEGVAAKLREEFDAKLVAARKAAADDAARANATVAALKADLANVMTPSQALDLWLPLLAEARRPADAAPAAALADKVLATAPADSEEAAKARTLKGLALLVGGQGPAARAQFALAKSAPGFAADKPWAKLADEGNAAVSDPLARLRKPADPQRKDPEAAVRALDAGIRAYLGGRFAAAEAALAGAVLNDAANPVAWYYLGAARWAQGKADAAREDFRQGAEREKARTVPSAAVDRALAPIQGGARAAIGEARP